MTSPLNGLAFEIIVQPWSTQSGHIAWPCSHTHRDAVHLLTYYQVHPEHPHTRPQDACSVGPAAATVACPLANQLVCRNLSPGPVTPDQINLEGRVAVPRRDKGSFLVAHCPAETHWGNLINTTNEYNYDAINQILTKPAAMAATARRESKVASNRG